MAYGTYTFMRFYGSMGAKGPTVRVLTYHRFGDRPFDPFCVSIPDFSMQMRWLAETGKALTLDQLEAHVAGKASVPDGSVLVSIDDGFRSVYTEALPVLQEFKIPAVVFVPTGSIGKTEKGTEFNDPYMLPGEIKNLSRAGIVIGSHSDSHRSMAAITSSELEQEAKESKDILEKLTGRAVTSFAYPYGTRADFNRETALILRKCGYTTVFTSQHGAIHAGMDPLELPRVKIESGESIGMFRRICGGGMDNWALVDRLLSGMQNVNRK